ncbi:MAG: hypothetical protein ABIG84_04510 [archaeon]
MKNIQKKIIEKIKHLESDIQGVKDANLKRHLKSELIILRALLEGEIRREFSYFKHITLTITGATGVILFWRGIYELTSRNEFLRDPYFSFVAGLIILALTGLLSRQFISVPTKATRPGYDR